MTNYEITGCIIIVIFVLWLVYEVRNAPEMEDFD